MIGRYVPEEDIVYGKNDYALLTITKTSDPNGILPSSFPFLTLDTSPFPIQGSAMYMVGYAASYLGGISVAKGLSLMASPVILNSLGSIKNSLTKDTLVFKGAASGQHGSSGGAVIRTGGKFTAIPTYFEEEGMTTGESTINALTIDYINRDLKADTGFTLQEFIARDTPQALSQKFLTEKAPGMHKKYVDKYATMNTKGTIFIVPGAY